MEGFRGLTRVAALALAAVVLAGCAPSDGPHERGPGAGRQPAQIGPSVDEIILALDLTEEQTPEVRGVLEAAEDERCEIWAKHADARGPGPLEQVRKELEGLRVRTETMLEPLLTDEQMARYRGIIERAEAERERVAEEMRGRRPGGPGGGMRGRPGS